MASGIVMRLMLNAASCSTRRLSHGVRRLTFFFKALSREYVRVTFEDTTYVAVGMDRLV
jgi:hypothetical protein